MAAVATYATAYSAELMVLAWAGIIAAHIYALVRLRRRRLAAMPSSFGTSGSRMVPTAAARFEEPAQLIATGVQVEKLFAFVEQATAAAERAMAAHTAAAKHLDSAEYQLLRLFEEFPMLTPARGRVPVAAASIKLSAPPLPHALAA